MSKQNLDLSKLKNLTYQKIVKIEPNINNLALSGDRTSQRARFEEYLKAHYDFIKGDTVDEMREFDKELDILFRSTMYFIKD